MSQIDKYKKLKEEVNKYLIDKYFLDLESAKMAMLSLIAENTAIIADSMSREEGDAE